MSNRPRSVKWPKKAVVTAGMPYGNKPLHFGHIGGVFVPADAYARFLRDRIGAENVRFVSGTDCYGSPIDEGYRKAVENDGFDGSIYDYVFQNHMKQADSLEDFDISLDIFQGSGIGHAGEVHQSVSNAFIEGLYERGFLHLEETLQFFDRSANTFLNGRQVVGSHCPVNGCKAEHAYADECDLGHSYMPEDLPNPRSTISGECPEMLPVKNWYFDLPAFKGFLKGYTERLIADEDVRDIVPKTISEFLVPPVIFIKNELYQDYLSIEKDLPPHTYREAQKGKQSFELEFDSIVDRDIAKKVLAEHSIRNRPSKALVPFRITGSIEWGVKAPVLDDVEDLSVWCWPESLWAPISFTIARNDELDLPRQTWEEFWCADDSCVYQFIGQDNLYFYGIAQVAMWEALGERGIFGGSDSKKLRQTRLIPNHHLLFGKTKASSSGDVKPPTGDQLLQYYTVEQLRAHFLALGLDQRSVGFSPKVFDPTLSEEQREDPRVADPVLKEGALLTNVFNRLARSCIYEANKNFGGFMPLGTISQQILGESIEALREYEELMHKVEFHSIMQLVDRYIRFANKHWADNIKTAMEGSTIPQDQDPDVEASICDEHRQLVVDTFYMLWISTLMMHPIVPHGTELICEYLAFKPDAFFSWGHDFESMDELCEGVEIELKKHRVKELPPRFDFFRKHESQYK